MRLCSKLGKILETPKNRVGAVDELSGQGFLGICYLHVGANRAIALTLDDRIGTRAVETSADEGGEADEQCGH